MTTAWDREQVGRMQRMGSVKAPPPPDTSYMQFYRSGNPPGFGGPATPAPQIPQVNLPQNSGSPMYGSQQQSGWNTQYNQTSPYGYFGPGMAAPSMGGFAQSLNTMSGLGDTIGGAFAGVNALNSANYQARLPYEAEMARLNKIMPILSQALGAAFGNSGGHHTYQDQYSRQRVG